MLGQKLVHLVSMDEDVDQNYTYRIVSDKSGLFSVSGDYLIASRMFDYETEPDLLLEIEVESTDDATPPLSVSKNILYLGNKPKSNSRKPLNRCPYCY